MANLKEKLKKIRSVIKEETKQQSNISECKTILGKNIIKSYELDDKVDKFINWYIKNMVEGKYTEIGEYRSPKELKNFIEKMAVWYELRYPEYEINRMMPGSNQEETYINIEMFKRNSYIKEYLKNRNTMNQYNEFKNLNWSDFYNIEAFYNSLPCDERCYLIKPFYNSYIKIEPFKVAHIHLTDGFVDEAEHVGMHTLYKIRDNELKGIHITEVKKLFDERKINLSKNNGIDIAIENYEKKSFFIENLLDCVMYRIIERGGNRIGPRRGFLFAKEFNRNIDIPMIYGVDYSDPGLRLFINEYIKAGGSKDLVCFIGYGSRSKKNELLKTVTIEELIRTRWNNCVTKYTEEETELHQRLVNSLSTKLKK